MNYDAAYVMATRLAAMMTERCPELRNRRSEAQILDELSIIAWGLREFVAAQGKFAPPPEARKEPTA